MYVPYVSLYFILTTTRLTVCGTQETHEKEVKFEERTIQKVDNFHTKLTSNRLQE